MTLCEKGFIIAACCFFLPSLAKVSVTLQNNSLTCPISVYFKVWFLYHRQQIQSLCHRRHCHHYYHYYITIMIIVIIFIITIWRAMLRLSSFLFLLLVSFFLTRVAIGASYCGEWQNHSLAHSFSMILAIGMSSQYLRYSLSSYQWYLKLLLVITLPKKI